MKMSRNLRNFLEVLMRPQLSTMLHHAHIFKISSAFIPVAFFFLSTIVYSGEYHNPKERTTLGNETLACGQCHTMHGTEALSQTMTLRGTPGTYPKLLRADTVLNLCLYCHDGTYTGLVGGTKKPPVVVYNTAYVPSAGDFQNANIINEGNRHSINTDVSLTANYPPGNNGTTWSGSGPTYVTGKFGGQFTCIFCHDQHGNKNYRNLRYDAGNPANDNATSGVKVTYNMDAAASCSDGGATPCDINNSTSGPLSPANLNKYQRGNVTFKRASNDTTNQGIAAWCGRCHIQFYGISQPYGNETSGPYLGGDTGAGLGLGDFTASNPWRRHPIQDINIGAANLHTDTSSSAYITSGTIRTVDPDGTLANKQPFCLSCHYAHGGGNLNNCAGSAPNCLDHSNLVMIDNVGNLNICTGALAPCTAAYDTSTGYMRNTCQQCHNQ